MKVEKHIDSWEFVSLEKLYMKIQVNFTKPLEVSSNIRKDNLKIKVLNEIIFSSSNEGFNV